MTNPIDIDMEPTPMDPLPVGEVSIAVTQTDLKDIEPEVAERISDPTVYTVSCYDTDTQCVKQHPITEIDGQWFIDGSQEFPNVNGGLASADEAIAEVQAHYTAKANKDGWARLAAKYPPIPEVWIEHMLTNPPSLPQKSP